MPGWLRIFSYTYVFLLRRSFIFWSTGRPIHNCSKILSCLCMHCCILLPYCITFLWECIQHGMLLGLLLNLIVNHLNLKLRWNVFKARTGEGLVMKSALFKDWLLNSRFYKLRLKYIYIGSPHNVVLVGGHYHNQIWWLL